MNLSGEVIKAYLDFFKIEVNNLLIIVDDLDTEVGKIKLRYKGSSGGHNGLKNIENHLKTQDYKRLKIGISNDKNKDSIDYVIGKVPVDELMNSVNKKAESLIDDFLSMNFDNVMNKYNSKG